MALYAPARERLLFRHNLNGTDAMHRTLIFSACTLLLLAGCDRDAPVVAGAAEAPAEMPGDATTGVERHSGLIPEYMDTSVRPGFIVVGPLPEPNAPGDFNGDGIVEWLDHAELLPRMNGPFADPTIAGWHVFDFDFDYDVDLRDYSHLANLFEE